MMGEIDKIQRDIRVTRCVVFITLGLAALIITLSLLLMM